MGYYTGDGVVVSGGNSTRTLKSFYEWGSFAVRQRSIVSTLKKSGVSLDTAKGVSVSDSLTAVCGGFGDLAWVIFDAEGTRKSVSYSQINGSNLYDLNITTETLSAWLSSTTTRDLT